MAGKKKPTVNPAGTDKLWFKLMIGSEEWEVWIVDPLVHPIMEPLEGLTVCTLSKILINKHVAESRRPGVLMHEMVHAMDHHVGFEKIAAQIFGVSEVTDAMEESIVSLLAPIFYDTLSRNGLLNLPKVPR